MARVSDFEDHNHVLAVLIIHNFSNIFHVWAVLIIRSIIRFVLLQGQTIENFDFEKEFPYIHLSFFLQFTYIDCEYVILFILTQINVH